MMTRTGNLDPDWKFWHFGGAKFGYCPTPVADKVRALLGDLAEVHDLGEKADLPAMLEGGGTIHTQFLQADLVDEIQLAVAPFLLRGPGNAPVRQPRHLP